MSKRITLADGTVLDEGIVRHLLHVLSKGLCDGLGPRSYYIPGKVCVEQAVNYAVYGNTATDHPACVDTRLAGFKIGLNDSLMWPDPHERANGLRRIAIAQLGTAGDLFSYDEFRARLAPRLIALLENEGFILLDGDRFQIRSGSSTRTLMRIIGDYPHRRNVLCSLRDAYVELAVQVLKEMDTPGSKFLYMTEEVSADVHDKLRRAVDAAGLGGTGEAGGSTDAQA